MSKFITGKIKELEVRCATPLSKIEDGEPIRFHMYADKRTMAMIMHAMCPIVKRAITKYQKEYAGNHDNTPRQIADLILKGEYGSHEQSDAMRIYQEIIDATGLPDIANVNDNWG
jgi:hypothetical protein